MAQVAAETPLLAVRDLHASIGGVGILKGMDLAVGTGEVHAIMGPNGSGKSTFANVLAGRPGYTVTGGEVLYRGQNLLALPPEKRAREGLFLAFQYPVELPGVRTMQFLKAAVDALREHRGQEPLDLMSFNKYVRQKIQIVEMDPELLKRNVNEGFSGGEKKRNEILQMVVLEPMLALLDETDSGLDIDALKTVANGVNRYRGPEVAIVLVTHYQRLLNYIAPDYVHVLIDGRIVQSGGADLAHELEAKGYDWLREPSATGSQTAP